MSQKRFWLSKVKLCAVGLALALFTAGCSGAGGSQPAESTPEKGPGAATTHAGHGAAGATVEMRLVKFRPEQTEVAAGTEVVWTQGDAGLHTVTSGTVEQNGGGVTARPDGRFGSDRLATDQVFRFRFEEPGTYPYFCEIHPATMTGEVRVGT